MILSANIYKFNMYKLQRYFLTFYKLTLTFDSYLKIVAN